MNEDFVIQNLKNLFPVKPPLLGIGDDAALFPKDHKKNWVVTTDALVEQIHFKKEEIDPFDLGFKTVSVNVSDIASMGGSPLYGFLTIALPKKIEKKWVEKFIQGIKEACQTWKISLLGGDTVGSKKDIFLSFTLIGDVNKKQVKFRHLAKKEDLIAVTGFLGDSLGGLKAVQEKVKKTEEVEKLVKSHFRPHPHLREGLFLAKEKNVHGMMDLSDGLYLDLRKLIEASNLGAKIDLEKIPISDSLKKVAEKNSWNPLEIAITGGEDYCLLFTIPPKKIDSIQKDFYKTFKRPFFVIGKIIEKPKKILYQENGKLKKLVLKPFSHF